MKNKIYRLALLAAAAAVLPMVSSCDDKHDDYVIPDSIPVAAPVVSVANGDVLGIDVKEITLTFDVPVALNSLVSITLNDSPSRPKSTRRPARS